MKNDNNNYNNNNKRLARVLHEEVSEHCQGGHSFCVKGKVVPV